MGIDRQTVVIGGGVTGLACAYRLQQLGVSVSLLEASDRVGGAVETVRRDGFLFEAGPQCPRFPRPLWDLVRELGLEPEFVYADSRARRYVVKSGQLYRAPFSPGALLSTRLVSLRSKVRLLMEPFRRSQPPPSEESVAEFVRRKFDVDILDYLVDPFVSAVFFADSSDMGIESALPIALRWEREHGSVLRGALNSRTSKGKSHTLSNPAAGSDAPSAARARLTDFLPPLGSFKRGVATLTEKLSQKLGRCVHLGAQAISVRRGAPGSSASWCVRLGTGEELAAESVVISTRGYEAAVVLEDVAPDLSAALAGIPYSPLVVVASAYDRSHVRHSLDGFGFMVPRREGLRVISTTWNSSLFPGRVPGGKVLVTSFARPLGNEPLLEMSSEEIGVIVEAEVARVLGISGAPVDGMVWKYPNALPRFAVGHVRRIAAIHEALRHFPDLHLAGNYLSGRSLADCVESGFRAANDVARDMRTPPAAANSVGRT